MAAELGSDVPFFFYTPAAWCTGRGEKVTPVKLGRPLYFVLACPPVGLATADVYRNVTAPEQPETGAEIRQALADGNVEVMGRLLHNRLQAPAERLCPQVSEVLGRLARLGPAGQMMSGSGSTLFALCRSHSEAWRLVRRLRYRPEEEVGQISNLSHEEAGSGPLTLPSPPAAGGEGRVRGTGDELTLFVVRSSN